MDGMECVVGKVVLEGELELLSPLLVGDGMGERNQENDKDIHVLRDKKGNPYIPGTSLVGVLRERIGLQYPDRVAELFGDMKEYQSAIQASDVKFCNVALTFRDGVAIDRYMHTAIDGAKYDYEAVERGAKAPFRMEVTLRGCHTETPRTWQESPIRKDVVDTLLFLKERLAEGIHAGAMTAKGFGLLAVKNISMGLYDFARQEDVKAWLMQEVPTAEKSSCQLDRESGLDPHDPKSFLVEAKFALRSSLLIRNYTADSNGKAVAVMLKSGKDAVIPGTSLKGVLRHRAAYIMEMSGKDMDALEALMGTADAVSSSAGESEGRRKSRLLVDEAYISLRGDALVETEHVRNRIDRFTGGTIDSALFTTKPLWQKDDKTAVITLRFEILNASQEEAGLALFLLKDLWQGKLPLGGEIGVGRGALKGLQAEIHFDGDTYRISEQGKVVQGEKAKLESYGAAFCRKGA